MKRNIPPIAWQGFLEMALTEENLNREIGGFLFSSQPYSLNDLWVVFPFKSNTAPKPDRQWRPSQREARKIEASSRGKGMTLLGAIHTHRMDSANGDEFPSPQDLKFMKANFFVVGGVLGIRDERRELHSLVLHDSFGYVIWSALGPAAIRRTVGRVARFGGRK